MGGEVLDVWQRIPVHPGDDVEAAVIATGPPGAIFLLHHMKWGRPLAVRVADNACLLQLSKLSFGLGQLVRVQTWSLGRNWPPSRLNGVVDAVKRLRAMETGGKDSWGGTQQLPDVRIHSREMRDEAAWSGLTANDGQVGRTKSSAVGRIHQ